MKNIIPIFPLNLVLFPDSLYPLHIFEERYKRLVRRCISNNEYFGIVSKIDFDIAKIGCTVKVSTILKTYENGSMDIIVKGYDRFMAENTSMHKDGYLEAEIFVFQDKEFSSSDDIIYRETLNIFKNILERTSLKLGSTFWEKLDEASEKSFKLAEKSGLNLKQQQDLLALQSERERLNYLHKHLEKLETTLEKNEVLKDIISADGYINET